MIISMNTEKNIWKIQSPFPIKNFQHTKNIRDFLTVMKNIY